VAVRVAHQLGPLASDGVPSRHVILDTEAARHVDRDGERQDFALAVAEYLTWPVRPTPEPVAPSVYGEPGELWADVAAFTRNKHRTVVWAHNLAYDLRVSRALMELPALGYQLRGIVLEHQASWAVFRGHARTILCCDLASWLPTSLAKIAADLRVDRPPLPRSAGEHEQLLARCTADVAVTREAVLALLGMVKGAGMGPWRATGAGQSHAAWRRRWLTDRPLVHDSEAALAAERRAMWTGRCEAWRWGKVRGTAAHEYDLQLAYPNLAAAEHVPAQLLGEMSGGAQASWMANKAERALLAEVDVQVDQPVVPVEHGKLIHWPVGTFTTTLWDPELALLLDAKARVRVRRGWLYRRGPVLADFSRWLLAQLAEGNPSATPVQRRALKHMARTVIGRCALRYRSWEPYGTVPDFRLHLGELHDLDTGECTDLLHVGHELLTLAGEVEAEDSLPQITGWVMSAARARLWTLMQIAGLQNVLYVDTDSVVVNDAGAAVLDELIDTGSAWNLQHKGTHRSARILGPRQLQLGRERRLAGVPLKATRVAPGVYEGEVWRSIRESVARGEGSTVVLERRRWELNAVDNRRWHLPGGETIAHRVG
jgi:hypothetical protein